MLRTFPRGWPAVGLLLLRAVVGVTVVARGCDAVASHEWSKPVGIVAAVAICGGVALLIGRHTAIASVIVSIGTVGVAFGWIAWSDTDAVRLNVSTIFFVSMGVAIALSGPGAFSLDARLRERREIVVPSRN